MKKDLIVEIADLRFYVFHAEPEFEVPHVHVFKGYPDNYEAKAKVRIDGIAKVFSARGFNKQALEVIEKITQGYIQHFSSEWKAIHGKEKTKIEIKEDIEYGDVGLDPAVYLNVQNHKVRVTTFLDGDVYEELKRRANAGEEKGKYQTLMNRLLREALFGISKTGLKSFWSAEDSKMVRVDTVEFFHQFMEKAISPLQREPDAGVWEQILRQLKNTTVEAPKPDTQKEKRDLAEDECKDCSNLIESRRGETILSTKFGRDLLNHVFQRSCSAKKSSDVIVIEVMTSIPR